MSSYKNRYAATVMVFWLNVLFVNFHFNLGKTYVKDTSLKLYKVIIKFPRIIPNLPQECIYNNSNNDNINKHL